MYNDLSPVTLASSSLCLGYETEGWNLNEVIDDADETPREFTFRVVFENPFGGAPTVHAGLTGFDIDQRDSARLKIATSNIDAEGFDLLITAWGGTRVYETAVSWLAIGL